MDQLKQLCPGLLFGGIDILVSFRNVDIDSHFFRAFRQRCVLGGNLRIALRTQIPNGSRVFHQKCKVVTLGNRQDAGGVGSDCVSHMFVEPVVYMGEHKIQVRLDLANRFQFGNPQFLQAPGQACPIG